MAFPSLLSQPSSSFAGSCDGARRRHRVDDLLQIDLPLENWSQFMFTPGAVRNSTSCVGRPPTEGGQLVRTSSVDICTEVISISYADEAGQLLPMQLLLLLLLLLAGKVLRPPSGSGGLNAFV